MVESVRPKNLGQALEMRPGAIPFAGGTDLMVKHQATSGALPDFSKNILYIGDLSELKGIEISQEGIRIGAGVKLSALLEEQGIPDYIKRPIQGIGSPAIRNLGTIGGNICNASPAGDSIPLFYALDARLKLVSTKGSRTIGISDFIKGPGKTDLGGDEILTELFIPSYDGHKWAYRKIGARKANAVSKLSVFIMATIDQSLIKDIRIALGAMGPIVIRSRVIEKN